MVNDTVEASADKTRTLYAKWDDKTMPNEKLDAQIPAHIAEENEFTIQSAISTAGFKVTYRPAGSDDFYGTLPVDNGIRDEIISHPGDDDCESVEQNANCGISSGEVDHNNVVLAAKESSCAAAHASLLIKSADSGLPECRSIAQKRPAGTATDAADDHKAQVNGILVSVIAVTAALAAAFVIRRIIQYLNVHDRHSGE